MSDNLTY